ncbi:MAG: type I glyceraldehyde-3-phosphate dehydrogenase [Elusimicrobia bacterium CG1_02_63_36]|nr:MAG: type I glyceraldehyde-3-phosphate dehydrogenase [Elusimicrobia bacterium CG1_02_63_36]PIP83441.1 MAG: type I glyceraldehyde-3-phosphate dehydrogenase [Elusimicrobia bacterium CG22_combo_CG10-13_8_21_14_all_63_91]PJA13505.1 MAG: type I glyceraldehyde-3-phosphate dehydrogenase [Elusimicrobia bacterium CG_4_10_14_0_2_um_filter_63_34]PJB25391.1 MAG: type I glyceraldehyde-3-phosphate dehydrogenase [Elusimicrobia bacterium CG_4_9_14_3_um_filter_62_55]
MAMKVAINGFGRIGRLVLRAGLNNPELEFVAVNDLCDAPTLAHLFKYDSTFGIYPGSVEAQGSSLVINGKKIAVTAERNPADLPWAKLDVELVIESTGLFRSKEKAGLHLKAGAKKVIISAPGEGEDITICMGINDDKYDAETHHIISNASCTTNCLAPLVKLLNDQLGIEYGIMTTVHSYTNDQVVLDVAHKDLRRARAAAVSMIPSSTGAAKAIGLVVPELKGKLSGCAIRVPTPDVSLVDFAVVVKKKTTKDEVNAMFKKAASEGPMAKILDYTETPLVSKDFTGNPASSTFDATLTDVMEGTLVKVFAWYDNEWGYSNRVVDLAAYIATKVPVKA